MARSQDSCLPLASAASCPRGAFGDRRRQRHAPETGVAAHSRQGLMSPLRKGQESVFYLPSFLQANTCVFVSRERAKFARCKMGSRRGTVGPCRTWQLRGWVPGGPGWTLQNPAELHQVNVTVRNVQTRQNFYKNLSDPDGFLKRPVETNDGGSDAWTPASRGRQKSWGRAWWGGGCAPPLGAGLQ